jgi:hypothetical protein
MKSLHEDDIGKLRERLSQYEEMPSEDLWSKIDAKRDKPGYWTTWVEPISFLVIGAFLTFIVLPLQESSIISTERVSAKAGSHGDVLRVDVRSVDVRRADVLRTDLVDVSSDVNENAVTEQHASNIDMPRPGESYPTERIKKDSASIFSPAKQELTVKPKLKKKTRFQTYLTIRPSLSYNKIMPLANDYMIVEGLASRSSMSSERVGISVDAGFQKDLSHILGVFGGISFYRQKQHLTYHYLENETSIQGSSDVLTITINPVRTSRSFDYSMTNIGLRAGMLLTLKGDRLKHKFGAAIAYQHGFARSSESYNNQQSWYVMGQVLYRNEYWINESFSLLIEPSFGYAFISHEKLKEPFALKPYRVGMGVGVLYRFND